MNALAACLIDGIKQRSSNAGCDNIKAPTQLEIALVACVLSFIDNQKSSSSVGDDEATHICDSSDLDRQISHLIGELGKINARLQSLEDLLEEVRNLVVAVDEGTNLKE
jgi:hypothetical protein